MARKKSFQAPEENVIEPGELHMRQPDLLTTGTPRPSSDTTRAPEASERRQASATPSESRAVPQSVRDRFLQIGEKFLFPTGEPAFRDLGKKLTTRSENAEVVRTLVEIAQVRGWSEIKVSGTTPFRRAVWQEATLANLAVKGFTPKDVDEAQLARRMARRQEAREEATAAEPSKKSASTPERDTPTSADERGADRTRPAVTYGTLLAHGAENYKLNPHEDLSYFVKLKTDDGREQTLWGLDLERAIHQSKTQPRIGDRIGIAYRGEKTVTITKREHDTEGRLLSERPTKTHRNEWIVEAERFFHDREQLAAVVRDASIDSGRASDRHPELSGTYVALKGTELYAERHIPDAHDRKRFLQLMRRTMAKEIARGDPLYAPALRDRLRSTERTQRRGRDEPEMVPVA